MLADPVLADPVLALPVPPERLCAAAAGIAAGLDGPVAAAGTVLGGLLLLWAVLLLVLWLARPDDLTLRDALRLVPDVVRLVRRLAADPAQPRGVRVRLWLLLAYLALPVDLVPDVVPVLGHVDDAVVVVLALRSVVRRAGWTALEEHWPGTPEGLRAVRRLVGAPRRP